MQAENNFLKNPFQTLRSGRTDGYWWLFGQQKEPRGTSHLDVAAETRLQTGKSWRRLLTGLLLFSCVLVFGSVPNCKSCF